MSKALCLLVLGLLIASGGQAKPLPPEEAALHFYRWYLQSLTIRQDPLRQSPVQISGYVDKHLISIVRLG